MFAKNLKELRLAYGLSQKELAEELGTSQPSYVKWENGKTSPTLKTIKKIANVFDVPISQLVNDNVLELNQIFRVDYFEYNGFPLSNVEAEDFLNYFQQFCETSLKHYDHSKQTKMIKLKNGKWITYNPQKSI